MKYFFGSTRAPIFTWEIVPVARERDPTASCAQGGGAGQPPDAVLHRYGAMAVAAGELLTADAFDFEPDQEIAFFNREPSHPLAVIQELLKKDFGIQRLRGNRLFNVNDPVSFLLFGRGAPRLVNRPAKRVSAQLLEMVKATCELRVCSSAESRNSRNTVTTC